MVAAYATQVFSIWQQWRIQGGAGGGRPPLLTECIVKTSKNFAPKCIISA